MKVEIEYHFKRGDTVYFVMFDQLQQTTIKMVLATINGSEEKDDNKVVYVVDDTKIKKPEKQRGYRSATFENYFSVGNLYKTPEEAIQSLLKPTTNEQEK